MKLIDALGPKEKRVWRIDSIRQGVDGAIQPFLDSVFILVAIRFFSVGDFWKGLIAASNFIGFVLSALLTGFLNRSEIRRSRVIFFLTMGAAFALIAGTMTAGGIAYSVAVSLCSAAIHIRQPFFTDLYGEFYSTDRLAKRISLGLRINLVVSLITGLCYGFTLDIDINLWRILGLVAAVILMTCAFILIRLPEAEPVRRNESWLGAMAIPFRNPLFLYIQAAWMFVGFGNLLSLPLRAVYLAEPERGLGLKPSTVTLILVVIPVALKFLFTPLWAHLYNRLSFPAMRASISTLISVATPLFFLTDSMPVIIAATALFGIAISGSPYIWQLWVTRIAGPGEVRIYQSAHAFLAGIRGIIAPFAGFAILREMPFSGIGLISGSMALMTSLMMIPLFRKDRIF